MDHESRDDSMEVEAIVVPFVDQGEEAPSRDRQFIRMELNDHVTCSRRHPDLRHGLAGLWTEIVLAE